MVVAPWCMSGRVAVATVINMPECLRGPDREWMLSVPSSKLTFHTGISSFFMPTKIGCPTLMASLPEKDWRGTVP